MSLENRIAIVTGASAGIGLAIAEALSAAGARMVINARRQDRLDEVAARLGVEKTVAVAGDCADVSVIGSMLSMAKNRFGRDADLIVVNAGRGLKGSVLDSDASQWEEMIRTNLLGAAHLCRGAGQRMLAGVEGDAKVGKAWSETARDIIVIGSVVGRNVSPFSSMYGSTKFAVAGLAEGLRRELGPKGIRVTLVSPGFVVSEFQGVAGYAEEWFKGVVEKIGPVLTPEDVARTVAFIVAQPAHCHVSDVVVRPTRQDYP